MSVPTQVVQLVEQFKDESQAVKSSDFKEAWVRRDYIDPFFGALGWDVGYQRRGELFLQLDPNISLALAANVPSFPVSVSVLTNVLPSLRRYTEPSPLALLPMLHPYFRG